MAEITIGILGLFVLLLLFATGIELGFAMALVGFAGFWFCKSFDSALLLLGRDFFDVIASYGFTVFPLFILMGQIGFNSGIALRLYESAHKFVGHVPGGIAMSTVLAATAFKAICGSSVATSATFSSIAIPQMDHYGYDRRLSSGIVAIVGTLGCIVPPSVVLIIFGILTEQSIGMLFLAGMIPGAIIAFLFLAIIYTWARINPSVAPRGERSTWNARFKSLPGVILIGVVFVLIMGGIMTGLFTPTEAGSVGTFAILLLGIFQGGLTLQKYWQSLKEALRTTCMILMLVAGSTIFGHFIAITNIPQAAAEWISTLTINRNIILFFICMIFLIGGSFIEDLAFMILAIPIFYPSVLKLGFDPIWFGIVIGITVMIGVVIPPMAVSVFVVKTITNIPVGVIYKGVYPFLIALVICGILLVLFPQLATYLPAVLLRG